MVWISNLNEAKSPGFIKLVSSLVIVWTIGLLGPSSSTISDAIARQMAKLPSMQLDWGNSDAWADYNTTKLAVMIDSRPTTTLAPQILHMMVTVPPDWPFLFLGSAQSIAMVNSSRSIQEQEQSGRLRFQTIVTDYHSKEGSHRLLSDPKFYDEMIPRSVEWLFIYSHDSVICSNALGSLDDWLKYDWVSGPNSPTDDRAYKGSGGFSLRRVSTVRHVLSFQARDNNTDSEEQFLSYRMKTIPEAVMPSAADASRFVTEHTYDSKSLGVHIGNFQQNMETVWADAARRQEIFNHCPELKMVMTPMKLLREKCA